MNSLQELVGILSPSPLRLKVLDGTVQTLKLFDSVPTGYVWPNIREVNSNDDARIAIVIAAGAVGKSAAAVALAASLQWPIVDAANAQVGSYSLSGLLHDALGFESNYMAEIASGRAGVIIDALDEAHLRAGTTNLQAFLDNIRKLAGNDHSNLSIVVFSRPDTAEIVELFFTETETPYRVWSLDYFDHGQACSYLESRLAQLHSDHPERDYGVSAKHPSAFAELRDKRMSEIVGALLTHPVDSVESVWADVAGFLGYAPVLSVLAEYLAVSNPSRELSRPLNVGTGARSILLRIVENLLAREQKKFQEQVCPKLTAQLSVHEKWLEVEEAYSPQEQGIRLVARFLGLSLAVQPPALLPPSLRVLYDQDATQFTADHPFLAGTDAVNVVFGDYLLAKAAINRDYHLALKPDPRGALKAVGPFFYEFVHEFAPGDKVADPPERPAEITDNLVSLLLASYSQSQIDLKDSVFTYFQSGEYAFLLIGGSAQSGGKAPLEFEVVDLCGVLVLPHRLARGFIFTDGGVVLGQAKQRFLLGPAVSLHCAELDIEAGHISVDARGADGSHQPCHISSAEIRVMGKLTIDAPRVDALEIFGEGHWPALRPYIRPLREASEFSSRASYIDLRAILKGFRQGAGRLPSVYGELMNQRIVKTNPTRKRFLASLQALEIVYEEADHYYLRTSKLTELGINWHSVIDGVPTEPVLKLLERLSAQ